MTCLTTYFEDMRVGDRDDLGGHTFTAEEIKTYARSFDPQPFHTDEAAARQSHVGALCASGWHVAAMWMRHYVASGQARAAAARASGLPATENGPSPGVRDLCWPKPVYVGDTVCFAVEIVELRHLAHRPHWGLLVIGASGVNQNGELVLSFRGAQFVRKRTSARSDLGDP